MTIEPKDLYKMVFDTRNLEITLFWQRSNYFLVLNTGLALGYFNLKSTGFGIFLSIVGIISSYLWFRVCLGSKFWQSRWEHRLDVIERYYRERGDIPKEDQFILFSADPQTITEDVKKSLTKRPHGTFQRKIDEQILKKPSVSSEMTKLSVLFVVGWIVLLGASIYFYINR